MNNSLQNMLAEITQLRATGRFQEALTKCLEASRIDPGDAEVLRQTALVYRDLKQPTDAINLFDVLRRAFPDNPDLTSELALTYESVGDIDKAITLAQEAVNLDNNSIFCNETLGYLALRYESWMIAAEAYQRLTELQPDNPMGYRYWSQALNKSLQYIKAAKVYENVIRIDGMTFEHAYTMARFYFVARAFEDAQGYYEKAIELEPKNVGPYLGLARTHIQLGNLDKGEEQARKALEIKPDYVYAFSLLNELKPEENNKKAVEMLEDRVAQNDQWYGDMDKAHTHLFLGQHYHKEKDFDRAFENLKIYNDERAALYIREKHYYNREIMEENFTSSKEIFSKSGLKKLEGCGSDSDVPIFIVATPRSGTTLLEQIIATHSEVYGAGEVTTMGMIFLDLNFQITQHPDRGIHDIIRDNASKWADMYLESLRAPEGVKHVTDKMPVNFIYCGLMQAIFPNARIIHIKRNPLDNCLSMYSNNFSESCAYTARLEDLGHYYNLYADLMDHWKKTLSMKYLEICYEDLVDNQEEMSREVLEFCGLPWEDRVLQYYKGKKAAYTISQVQVSKPINKKGVARWKPYEKHIQPLIKALDAKSLAAAGVKK